MAAKPIRISRHAQMQMKRRGVNASEVTRIIRWPDQVVPSTKGRQIFQGLIGKTRRLLLRVVIAEDSIAYRVITVYKTSKISKYWRAP
jgi:hypothetical protein